MNRGLKKLWNMGKTSSMELFAQLGITWDQIADDFKDLRTDTQQKICALIDEWAEDETLYKLFEGFLAASAKGREAAVEFLQSKNHATQEYLAAQVRLTPHLVGGIDGFLQVYLATSADRWTRSPRYRKGARCGRVIGVICAFTVFLPVSVGRAIISLLPGASRCARYIANQWSVAKERRDEARRDAESV